LCQIFQQNPTEYKKQLEIERTKNQPKTEIKEIIKEVPAPQKSF
jgi:hypothetical protein